LLTDEELSVYHAGDDHDPYRTRPSRLRFAHTSPIYVTVDSRGAAVHQSIEEGLRMLERFKEFADQTASPKYRPSIQLAVTQAEQNLRARLGP
jgi:hypothetical protein